jgi:hypothetical protein
MERARVVGREPPKSVDVEWLREPIVLDTTNEEIGPPLLQLGIVGVSRRIQHLLDESIG